MARYDELLTEERGEIPVDARERRRAEIHDRRVRMRREIAAADRSEARAARKKARATDAAPRSRGPRAPAKGPRKLPGGRGLSRTYGKAKRIMLRAPKRTLLVEGLAVMVIVTAARIAKGEPPQPWDYVAPFVVYLVLSFAAELGPAPGKVAAGLGGLILLAVFLGYGADLVLALRGVEFGPGEGPTTLAAQGVSGFRRGQSGQGAGGGAGGSW